MARALLQYRNTTIQSIGLSPAQFLFHCQMPNHPTYLRLHKKWLISAKQREQLASIKKGKMMQNKETPVRNLSTLPIGTKVAIQDQRGKNHLHKWNRTDIIVKVLPYRQYQVRMDDSGLVSLRNRQFVKAIPSSTTRLAPTVSNTGTTDMDVDHQCLPTPDRNM